MQLDAPVPVHTGPDGPRRHVIVCGLHALGIRIIEQLYRSGTEVVVVDDGPDHRLLGPLGDWGVEFVRGSPRQPGVLVGAGALEAVAVIRVDGDDLRALESALVAHDLRPDLRVVAQIPNPSVARALGGIIGAANVLAVADQAAPSLIQACLDQRAHDLDLKGTAFGVREDRCRRTGTLRSLYGDLVPLAVVRAGTTDVEVTPGRDEQVAGGDVVTLLGVAGGAGRRRPGSLGHRWRRGRTGIANGTVGPPALGLGRGPRSPPPGLRRHRRPGGGVHRGHPPGLSPTGRAPPRPARLALLHGGDHLHGRLRGLHLLQPG